MHWTLDQLLALPLSYYEALREMVEEDANRADS